MNLTRRTFVRSSISAVTALQCGQFFVRASDKAGVRPPIVGDGEFVFECIHNWYGDRPAKGHLFGTTHGIAISEDGHIFVTHHGDVGSVYVFSPDRKFVRAMGDVHHIDHGRGHGIDIRSENGEEFIYLSPNDKRLGFTKMSLDGQIIWQKDRETINRDSGGALDDPRVKFRPTNTSFRPDGGYYLGDGYGSHLIFEYDRNDQFVRVIGRHGTADGEFSTPHGQWLDDRSGEPRLVVADRANRRLQWFDSDGNHIQSLGGFLCPADIDIQGDLMVVPDLHARITLLGRDNQVVAQLGDDKEWRQKVLANSMAMRNLGKLWEPGRFVHPHDACFDADGNIHVAEWVRGGRLTWLVRKS